MRHWFLPNKKEVAAVSREVRAISLANKPSHLTPGLTPFGRSVNNPPAQAAELVGLKPAVAQT
jgi:hypothetical protein